MPLQHHQQAAPAREVYRAFLDTFFPDDAQDLKDHLDTLVERLADGVDRRAVWAALNDGADAWQRQRLRSWVVRGDDTKGREQESLAQMDRARQQAAQQLRGFVGWLSGVSADPDARREYADAIRVLRGELTYQLEALRPHRRRVGRNWDAWNAAKAHLFDAGATDDADLAELLTASALGRPDPEITSPQKR